MGREVVHHGRQAAPGNFETPVQAGEALHAADGDLSPPDERLQPKTLLRGCELPERTAWRKTALASRGGKGAQQHELQRKASAERAAAAAAPGAPCAPLPDKTRAGDAVPRAFLFPSVQHVLRQRQQGRPRTM
jgi:hypothetical protein